MREEKSASLVPPLCREVGSSSCICLLPSFSWELKTGSTAALPVRRSLLLHRARTVLTLKFSAQKLSSGVVLDCFLISYCSEQSCPAPDQLLIDAASQHEARAAVLGLPWSSAPWTSLCVSWWDFPDSSWIWCTRAGQIQHTLWVFPGTEQKHHPFKYSVYPVC